MRLLSLLAEGRLDYIVSAQGTKLEQRAAQDTGQEYTATQVVQRLVAADPTGDRQKYLQWIVNMYLKKEFKLEDLYRINADLKEFDRLLPMIQQKDISQYKTLQALYDVIDPIEGMEVTSKRKQDADQGRQFFRTGEAKLIADEKDTTIIELRSEAAAKYFGRGTRWCTSAESNNMYDDYAQQGPLYVVIQKGKKFQFHFETAQFMDAQDRRLSTQDGTLSHFYTTEPTSELFVAYEQRLADRFVDKFAEDPRGSTAVLDPIFDYISEMGQDAPPKYLTDRIMALGDMRAATEFYCYGLAEMNMSWPELEKYVLSNVTDYRVGQLALRVATAKARNGVRWEEFEKAVTTALESDAKFRDYTGFVEYFTQAFNDRHVPLERALIKHLPDTINAAIKYAAALGRRWPAIEDVAKQMPHTAYDYAATVLRRPWPEAEDVINSGFFTRDAYAALKRAAVRK